MSLTKEQRENLPAEYFAVPGKRKLPINDATHARLAWDMVDRTQGLTEAERTEARHRIIRRAKELGIDTSGWEKSFQHQAVVLQLVNLEAMSLDLPQVEDHPNRMPFSGVLTFVDTPSDQPVGGAGGKRTYLPREVAQKALPSLLGMPIDFKPDFDGHDVKSKIGTITDANIVGDEIQIGGFFYAADFPQECARIKAEKEDLGFSYEIRAQTQDMGDGLLKIVDGVFTGAAVLRKDRAAYQSTSLAAQAAKDIEMDNDALEALLKAALAPVADQLKALGEDVTKLKAGASKEANLQANKELREKIAPHAKALRDCAAAMEAAGIGLHSERGHVRVLHHMAASMEAAAARGEVPFIYRDHDWTFSHAAEISRDDPNKTANKDQENQAFKALTDGVLAIGTKLEDLSKRAFNASAAPERKTLSSEGIALLNKAGLKADGANPIGLRDLEAGIEKAGLSRGDSIALKLALQGAGMLAAA